MLVIEIDDKNVRRAATVFLSTLSGEAQKATRATAEQSREHIASGAYWTNRTGKTGQSFRVTQDAEGLGASLSSGAKVARFLEAGTPPHVIRPRRKDALRFSPAGGGVVFARVVNHPGTKPKHYLAAESTRAEPILHAAVERAATEAATRSGLD